MPKDSFYFPHDYNAHNDPKLVKLSMAGWDLVGLYWAIVGMLHEQGGWLPNDPPTHAFALRVHEDRIAMVINFPDLFIIKEGIFTSNRVLDNLKFRHEKREKAQLSALKRWNDAKAMRTHSEGNAIKERKGKERKRKDIYVDQSSDWYKSLSKDFPMIDIDEEYRKAMLWEKDNKRSNHKRFFKNWLLNAKPNNKPKLLEM